MPPSNSTAENISQSANETSGDDAVAAIPIDATEAQFWPESQPGKPHRMLTVVWPPRFPSQSQSEETQLMQALARQRPTNENSSEKATILRESKNCSSGAG